jgi:glyoxylase-like metal-dependent hydrolase (beta-lactamase superfamily II)/rhodanese-related sulfurtransferase
MQEITVDELMRRLGTEDEPFLLDVREPDEVAAWSMPNAVNIPLGALPERVAEVPRDREVVVVCASGNRSAVAAEALASAGRRARNLVGGMEAWGRAYDTAVVEVAGARIVQVRRRGKGCLSYLVGAGDEAFSVDPPADVDVHVRVARDHGWRITRVFDTHLHADHLSGARRLAQEVGASLHLNPADTFDFEFEPLADGDHFVLPGGAELSVAALHTPGHTQGSTIYFVGREAALTGDTLFVDGVGRPDLAERAVEFARNLHRSLREKVLTLADTTLVLPGHHGEGVSVRPGEPVAATLGELRRRLAPLGMDEHAFVGWATERTVPRPPNYQEIVLANMGRPRLDPATLERLELGPNRCSVGG